MNNSPLPAVPAVFIAILDQILEKLVSLNIIDRDFIGEQLHAKLRIKFNNASKKVFSIIVACIF